jgi:hypothetical protein
MKKLNTDNGISALGGGQRPASESRQLCICCKASVACADHSGSEFLHDRGIQRNCERYTSLAANQ